MPERLAGEARVWFRRDLRDYDHAALHAALSAHSAVHCAFVFDTEILEALPSRADRRVAFIHASLVELKTALERKGGGARHECIAPAAGLLCERQSTAHAANRWR